MSLNDYVAPIAEIATPADLGASAIFGGGDIKSGIRTGSTTSGWLTQLNRIPVMVPLTAPLFGVIFRGNISLKK
jgi:hypothetical protein